MRASRGAVAVLWLSMAGCTMAPFQPGEPETAASSTAGGPGAGSAPVLSAPPVVAAPGPQDPVIDTPAPRLPAERVPPVRRAPTPKLSPATQSLVGQASAQRKRGDLPGAAISLDRALRIEPNNALLWIEMGRLRMDQKIYAQAESMGRKALAMSVGDLPTQSSAWTLIADSLQARGRNPQAQEAREKAKGLQPL